MVFEGGTSYIAGIMESSDELYAAAASLGIDLQLFYSYSSEMTDEIILSCIKMVTKSARDLCPKISDSETLAESFLTTFPSINPLSAHAILSTGGNLVNYMEWSPECRIRAVQKFHVPGESISLLSALSRFGEKENSLSGMTECSSSVSSGTDSDNIHYKRNNESKKRKYMQNNVDMAMPDSLYQGSLELLSNESPNSHGAFGPFSSEIFHDFGKTNLSSKDEMFGHSRQLDSKMAMKHHSMTEQCDLFMTNGRSAISLEPEHGRSSCAPGGMLNISEMFGAVNVPQIHQSDKFLSSQQMSNMLERNNRINTRNRWNSGQNMGMTWTEIQNQEFFLFPVHHLLM
ncbi:hypothetical protein Leryth_022010 [Lithospermum erythrorhizon]|nr:hypothetical protein Leryth_022010 [Lithospermum erythrorhizon]